MVEKSSQYEDIDIDSSESSPHSEEINSDIKPPERATAVMSGT